MNDQEMKEMVRAICHDLNLDGCYADIMPRVTGQQLAQLLDVAERGHNALMWSKLATWFLLRHGQKELVATHVDRLVTLVTESRFAAWVLREAPHLTDEHRNALVMAVTYSGDAAWVLRKAQNIRPANRDHLEKIAG